MKLDKNENYCLYFVKSETEKFIKCQRKLFEMGYRWNSNRRDAKPLPKHCEELESSNVCLQICEDQTLYYFCVKDFEDAEDEDYIEISYRDLIPSKESIE